MPETDAPEALRELPPSAKLVHYILEDRLDQASLGEIADEAMLPERTARYALDRLADEDLITKRPNPSDARQSLYHLKNRE